MDKELGTVVLVIITGLAIFAVVQPILPSNSEKFSELGILGPSKTISGYPKNLTVGQSFLLYGYVGNHENAVEYYQVFVKLGNQSTTITNTTYAKNVPVLATYSQVLGDNRSWIFPINLSINQNGTSMRLIFELWLYDNTSSTFQYTGLWNQLWVNVTKT